MALYAPLKIYPGVFTMLKRIIQVGAIIICSTILSACTLSHTPVTCDQLKRQWLYNNTNPNVEASWTTSSQHDALRQKMIEMNCL
jgi:hypothetical protein